MKLALVAVAVMLFALALGATAIAAVAWLDRGDCLRPAAVQL